ncbi:MAG: PEPxxWA-CTERM sorting domain-containing protein [Phenylobacterium sp.]|uniref:choice-of-anchor R domain-containing protein n=1 Tax=Phenylobacterium sp. TaxID=1871053 RepID=UPI001A5D40B1|nr:choice-of-anchor R domain-containing protein [Phenylobacterium sp.]MBL8773944.1 PEPxxWA-CTERM sorting domain-containing protein [Phenylobacterium sp.]
MRPAHLAFAAVLAAAPAARADVLLSNLAEDLRSTSPLSDALWAAQAFTNDGESHVLTSIRAVVGDASGDPDAFAELRAGSPTGALLTTFALPALGGALGVRSFTPLVSVTLDPGETYVFVLGVTGGGFGWSYAEGNGQVGTGSFGAYYYSEMQGADWTNFGGDNPFFMEVNVSGAVPEPAAWALMILGFSATGAMLRRRGSPRPRTAAV